MITACAVNLKPTNAADEGSFVSVGEIYENCNNVQKLYDLIGGAEHTKFSTITNLAKNKTNAADIRAKTYGKSNAQDIQVTFGGKVWDVVYLSMTNDNRPILTLWLHDPFTQSQWNLWLLNDASVKYPCNMYGTSYIRALINNGGQYAVDGGMALTDYIPVSDYALQEFLPNGKYSNLVVTPSYVSWQEKGQKFEIVDTNCRNMPNENWGVVDYDMASVNGLTTNYSEREGNSVWKNDNLWLASSTETRLKDAALFRLSKNQIGDNTSWARSGNDSTDTIVRACRIMDSDITSFEVTNFEYVRPALHLDLTALNATRTAEDATDHNFGGWTTTTEATCTTTGERERVCEGCDHVDSEVLPATGHDFSKTSFDKQTGITTMVCSVCNTKSDITYPCTDKENGHRFLAESDVVVAPKCEENGYTIHICEHCQYTYQSNFTPAIGHTFGEWKTIEEASINAAGVQQRICKNCGATQNRPLAALSGTTSNGGKDNSAPLLWGIIIGIIAVLAGCGGLAWLLLAVFKPKKEKNTETPKTPKPTKTKARKEPKVATA